MTNDDDSHLSTQSVARRLRLTRQATGLNKANFCRLVGISPQSWSNVEGTKHSPALNRISVEQAWKVIRATGVDWNWIWQGLTDKVPPKLLVEINRLEAAERAEAAQQRKKA